MNATKIKKFDLYVDDTGSRNPDRTKRPPRRDLMDHFSLGGFMINSEDIGTIIEAHTDLVKKYGITYPLHSSSIRTKNNNFSWLEHDASKANQFMEDLERLLTNIPIVTLACTIHRPGYQARYGTMRESDKWQMSRTAYCILLERATKYAINEGRKIKVYVEQSGKQEDMKIKEYHRLMREDGHSFHAERSRKYSPLSVTAISESVFKEVKFVSKKNKLVQIADLVLYPIAKAGYVPTYPPYRALDEAGKTIESQLTKSKIESEGSKYYCFDGF